MIKLTELLKEDTPKYEYGCVMLYFQFPKMTELHKIINPNDIYEADINGGYGLETEPHCTLLYGLHDGVSLENVTSILDNFKFGECKIYNPSLFENEDFDVLKFDVGYTTRGGAFLQKANIELAKLPNTQTYPDYHPHMTVAYLKPGMGKKYVDLISKSAEPEFIVQPDYAVYSVPSGTKTKIEIRK